ncbi:MAG: hypothetical protein HC905_31885, partial [Bacteroidales bacterium]|nr:hypothetical protein [Bacteroidales bacterium]
MGNKYTSPWLGPVEKPAPPVNQPPVAGKVLIRGNPVVCQEITGVYAYSDAEQDAESGSTFRWLRADNTEEFPEFIPGATSLSYTVTAADQNKYLYFEVTPKASSGNTAGTPVLSEPSILIQNVLPTVTFSGDVSVCPGVPVDISLTFTGTPPFKLEYTNG